MESKKRKDGSGAGFRKNLDTLKTDLALLEGEGEEDGKEVGKSSREELEGHGDACYETAHSHDLNNAMRDLTVGNWSR